MRGSMSENQTIWGVNTLVGKGNREITPSQWEMRGLLVIMTWVDEEETRRGQNWRVDHRWESNSLLIHELVGRTEQERGLKQWMKENQDVREEIMTLIQQPQ